MMGIIHRWLSVALMSCFLLVPPLYAADYENFSDLRPGFGSRTGTGDTGGLVAASDYDNQCVGYVDSSPDHRVRITEAMNLSFNVRSDTDSILLIIGPGGIRCNSSAQISGRFERGTYQVYVGNRTSGSHGRYILTIRESGTARVATPRQPPSSTTPRREHSTTSKGGPFRSFTLGAGFTPDPQTANGFSGPANAQQQRNAAIYGQGCTGLINSIPDHRLTITSSVNLRIWVHSNIDSTLVVRGPAGTFCDDDGAGNLDAQVFALLTPGEYEIYVGNVGAAGQYRLSISENTQAGGLITQVSGERRRAWP